MPPQAKPQPSQPYAMPAPSPVVVWQNAPGGDSCYAVVTRVGKQAVSLMLFPPDSRIGIPKDAVRYIGDPVNKVNGINAEYGVWDFTDETKLLRRLAEELGCKK